VKRITVGGADVLQNGLDLSQAQTVRPMEIVVSPNAGRIEGTVNEGDPYGETYVTLLPEPLAERNERFRRSAVAGANGRFEFQNVAPGDYRLYAWKERFPLGDITADDLQPYDHYGVSVRVEEARTEQVELEFVPLP
jgi:hypothetical protein